MMNNNFMFNSDGPVMTGTWFNPKTNDSFTVRNSFFEDNNFVVQTTDGRVLYYNQLQDYVQSNSKPGETPVVKPQPPVPNRSNNDLPPEVADLISDPDTESLLIPEDDIYNKRASQPQSVPKEQPVYNQNAIIIDKALSKTHKPSFNVTIKWPGDFPKQEIELLRNIMDIDMSEIIAYYYNNIDFNALAAEIDQSLINNIEKHLNITDKPEKPAAQTTATKSKKTTKKTN